MEILALGFTINAIIDSDFLRSELMREAYDEKDHKHLEAEAQRVERVNQDGEPFRKRAIQIYHTLNPGVRGDGPGGDPAGAGGHGPPAPHVPEDADFNEAQGQALCPPGATIKKDMTWNRWRVSFQPFGTKSKAFLKHGGVNTAMGKAVKWAWSQIRTPCPEAWIEALDHN